MSPVERSVGTRPRKGHQLSRRIEPARVADLDGKSHGDEKRGAAHRLEGFHDRRHGPVDQAIGRSRGGPTTKIDVIVDALGNPLALRLTDGQAHDITQAEALVAEAQPEALLGDKGYDADAFIKSLEARAITSRSSRQSLTARSLAIATSPSTPNATSSSVSFNSSNSSEASRPATKKLPAIPRRPASALRPRLAQMELCGKLGDGVRKAA